MLKAIFYEATEECASIAAAGFVACSEVDEIVDTKVPHAIFILHAAQARIFGQFQGDFHDLAARGLLGQVGPEFRQVLCSRQTLFS